jgi:hypothetical protein
VSEFTIIEKITGETAGGSLVISGLLAGEPMTGITTPEAVMEGSSTILTTLEVVSSGGSINNSHYDYTGRTANPNGQIQLNPNKRATSFTTPNKIITVNQAVFGCESNSTGSQTGPNFSAQIYTDIAGAPGTLLSEFTTTVIPLVNNQYYIQVPFPANVTLLANTTYWFVLEWNRVNDPGNFTNLYIYGIVGGGGLAWNGSSWVAGTPFTFGLGLIGYQGYVYKSYRNTLGSDPRNAFLGLTNQDADTDDSIDVIRDGAIPGFTGLDVGESYYMSSGTPGVLATTGDTKIAFATKATEIVVSRYTGIYQ